MMWYCVRSLAILTPGEGIVPGTARDRPVSLGSLIGKRTSLFVKRLSLKETRTISVNSHETVAWFSRQVRVQFRHGIVQGGWTGVL
jgi:hypothetical protein